MIDMVPQPTQETERLILRPFKLCDSEKVRELAGDKRIASTTLNVPHPYPEGGAEKWIATHESLFLEGKRVVYAITLKESGELIGSIGFGTIVNGHQAELSYWVGVPYWNKGYCSEAARAVLEYGFKDRELNRVHACYLTRNPASGRVLEKIGMVYEGTRRQHILKWGVFEDLTLMGVLRSEWEKIKEK